MEYLSNLEGVCIFLLDKSYRESSFYFERKSKKHSFLFLKHGFFVTIATISLLQKNKKKGLQQYFCKPFPFIISVVSINIYRILRLFCVQANRHVPFCATMGEDDICRRHIRCKVLPL